MKRSLSFTGLTIAALMALASFAFAQSSGTTPATPATPATAATPATPAKHEMSGAKHKTHAAAASATKAPMVDLNSASREDLVKLPGVGEAIADKIIAGRPWTAKDQLVSKGVVTKTAYAKFKGMVIAKQAKSS